MKRIAPFIIVAVVGLITAGAAVTLYRSKRPAPVTASPEKTVAIGDKKMESAHVRGDADAPVTLEEYGDFQCPPCGTLSGPLLEIEKDYGSKLRVIFHNFPFAIHQHARAAANAAEAAGLQSHFWQMHDLLFKEQAEWSKAPAAENLFESYAGVLGLNVEQFKKDVKSETVQERVTADQKSGQERGVKNTPTLFINNREVLPTSLNPNAIRAAIDEALKQNPAH